MFFNAHQVSGNFDTLVAGSQVNGNPVFVGQSFRKAAFLSAVMVVDAETNGITLTAKWQVSNDRSTWIDVANGSQNAASVVLATGTAGADAAVTKAIPAPEAVYGYKYARASIVTGAQTGTTSDTYTIGYSYRTLVGSEER
jgi:hypothetical protein